MGQSSWGRLSSSIPPSSPPSTISVPCTRNRWERLQYLSALAIIGWQVELATMINQHSAEGDSVLQVAKCLELEEQCREEEKQHWARVAALIQVHPQSQCIISPLPLFKEVSLILFSAEQGGSYHLQKPRRKDQLGGRQGCPPRRST